MELVQTEKQIQNQVQGNALFKNITGQESHETLKYLIYALDKNKILVRLTNMEDRFDDAQGGRQKTKNYTVDVKELASLLYKKANNKDLFSESTSGPNPSISIEETTLTGITNYKKRMSEDTQWQTREPILINSNSSQSMEQTQAASEDTIEEDSNGMAMTYKAHLEPQRIRAFKITYKI